MDTHKVNSVFKKMLQHIGIWLIILPIVEPKLTLMTILHLNKENLTTLLITYSSILLFLVPLFYIVKGFLYPRYIGKQKYILFVTWTLLVFILFVILRQYTDIFYTLLITDKKGSQPKDDFWQDVNDYWGNYIAYLGFFIGFCYFSDARKKSVQLTKQNTRLEEQQLEITALSAAKAESEISLLKSQINPHFLYNTLNMLYSKAVPYNEELATGIVTLSDMMRYALSSNKNNIVPLAEEIRHIEDIITINKLRFEKNMHLTFTKKGQVDDAYIHPLVLITLVENVFKHGAILSQEFPATIYLEVEDGILQFKTFNKKKKGMKEPGTGIGINNVLQRLEHFYNNKFSLEIIDEENTYSAFLRLQLK